MNFYKFLVILWLIGWLIIGVPYAWITHTSISEIFQNFLFCTLFFGGILAFNEGRDYIKKRANDD